jgi:hypothetical protein
MSRTAPTVSVTLDGEPLDLIDTLTVVEACAPELDTAAITVPMGKRRHGGAWLDTDPAAAIGMPVVITSGAWSWSGTVTGWSESAAGSRRTLSLTAFGQSLAAERCYPLRSKVGAGWRDGFPDFNPLGVGNRAAVAEAGGWFAFGGGVRWTQAEAVRSLLAQAADATEGCGLPALTLAGDVAGLTATDSWQIYGNSVMAALSGILPPRGSHVWRIAGDTLTVYGPTGAGVAVDCTGPYVTGYEYAEETQGAVADLIAHGQRRQFVETFLAYPGGGGDLEADWSGTDAARLDDRVDAYVAEGKSADEALALALTEYDGPAYRRFRCAGGLMPDGTNRSAARFLGGLPIRAGDTMWSSGGGPWLTFIRDGDGKWIGMPASIQVLDGQTVWIDGPDWVKRWKACDRVAITGCMESAAHVSASQTGGVGAGKALILGGAVKVQAPSGTYLGVTAAGTIITAGITSSDDSLSDLLADRWPSLGQALCRLSWTEAGIVGGHPCGTRIASAVLPTANPAAPRTVTPAGLRVVRREIRWQRGMVTTACTAEPPLIADNGQTR